MTADQFDKFWTSNYALTPPIPYLFRKAYPERWLRIHSLPESIRNPRTSSEWSILLNRQNTLITDLLGAHPAILLVTGEYVIGAETTHQWPILPTHSIQHVVVTKLKPIQLETLNNETTPDAYKPGDVYKPVFSELDWQSSTWNELLKEIAEEKLDAFFVSIANKLIIAPYDGGVDIILKDKPTQDAYKAKYSDWLSGRVDGL